MILTIAMPTVTIAAADVPHAVVGQAYLNGPWSPFGAAVYPSAAAASTAVHAIHARRLHAYSGFVRLGVAPVHAPQDARPV